MSLVIPDRVDSLINIVVREKIERGVEVGHTEHKSTMDWQDGGKAYLLECGHVYWVRPDGMAAGLTNPIEPHTIKEMCHSILGWVMEPWFVKAYMSVSHHQARLKMLKELYRARHSTSQ